MKTKVLIRLDDASPTMKHELWDRMEVLLDKYGVKPMVGVIPNNEDPQQVIDLENTDFWQIVKSWEQKGWSIAMHGYNHCYTSDKGMQGINPMWNRSEFSGLSLERQKEKIRKGVSIMRENGFNPRYFFAPSHTFDNNTLEALRLESDIRIICDTIGRYPYRKNDFVFIPQIFGHCSKIPFPGIYTFCFHPNTMNDASFAALESFLKQNHNSLICFDDINLSHCAPKRFVDRCLTWLFFFYRRLRGLY